ncbi:MAG: glycosyltransferase family 2 protein [Nocardioidaceae bacterium]|nr:glycosyltransferase family 2 protein [Nocardioidaceae bacterium]MCL2612337.1 glycosyltransferase family 2 protein [Nocardioidaceae bacterium]
MKPKHAVSAAVLVAVAGDQARRARARAADRREAAAVRSRAADGAVASTSLRGGLVVAIAALNEADAIAGVLTELPDEVAGLPVRVVVVDDGSSDATADIARAHGAIVAVHERNLGQGDGLRTGFEVAGRIGAEVVVTMDADGQHDPGELPTLVGPVAAGEADYVQGSRFLGVYDDAGGARHAGIKGFTTLINLLAGTSITDCTNGYRAIDAGGLSRMRLVEDRFSASEIIIEAAGRGLRMREVPVHIRSREIGESRKPKGLGYPLGYLGAVLRSSARSHLRPRRDDATTAHTEAARA